LMMMMMVLMMMMMMITLMVMQDALYFRHWEFINIYWSFSFQMYERTNYICGITITLGIIWYTYITYKTFRKCSQLQKYIYEIYVTQWILSNIIMKKNQ
jgi:hypothetical protein